MIERIKALIRSMDICVLATASGNVPHCSLMAYTTDDECHEIYMVTHRQTKKFSNLRENPSVSLLIDNREAHIEDGRSEVQALTVTGLCKSVLDEGKNEKIRGKILERHPHMKDFIDHSDAEVLSIKVKSFQLLDGITDVYYERLD